MKPIFLALVLLVLTAPAQAQSIDARWEPWLGCWQLTIDDVRSAVTTAELLESRSQPPRVRDDAPRVCVMQTDAGDGRFQTLLGDVIAIDRTVIADGTAHPLDDTECSGAQRAEWSTSGVRLFSSVEIRCEGESPYRVSGLSLIAPNGDWLDLQAVSDGERESLRVKRYTRADDGNPMRRRPSTLTLDEIKEASGRVSSAALEAALVETGASYSLSARRMVELADAGVSAPVIDLIVALSYPGKFVIERSRASGDPTLSLRDPLVPRGAVANPFFLEYYYSAYYYEPFGYRLRAYDFLDVVVVDPGYGGGQPPTSATGTGRVVNGQGYTRVGPRVTPTESGTSSTRNRGATSSSSSSSSSTSSPSSDSGGGSSSSSGSSGGGSVSSGGGYSNGGGESGRTAVPR